MVIPQHMPEILIYVSQRNSVSMYNSDSYPAYAAGRLLKNVYQTFLFISRIPELNTHPKTMYKKLSSFSVKGFILWLF